MNFAGSKPTASKSARLDTADLTVVGGGGHVGIPLVLAFADAGYRVNVHDTNREVLETLRAGRLPFREDRPAVTTDRRHTADVILPRHPYARHTSISERIIVVGVSTGGVQALQQLLFQPGRHRHVAHGAAEVGVDPGLGPEGGVALGAHTQVVAQVVGLVPGRGVRAGLREGQQQAGGFTIHRSPSVARR